MGLMYQQDNLDFLSFDLKPHLMKFVKKKIIKGLSVEVDSNHTLVDNDEPLKRIIQMILVKMITSLTSPSLPKRF